MNKRYALLVAEYRYAMLGGVVLSLRDWKKMANFERAAWLVARNSLLAPKKPSSPATSREEQLSGEDRQLRNVLEGVARDMVASEGR